MDTRRKKLLKRALHTNTKQAGGGKTVDPVKDIAAAAYGSEDAAREQIKNVRQYRSQNKDLFNDSKKMFFPSVSKYQFDTPINVGPTSSGLPSAGGGYRRINNLDPERIGESHTFDIGGEQRGVLDNASIWAEERSHLAQVPGVIKEIRERYPELRKGVMGKLKGLFSSASPPYKEFRRLRNKARELSTTEGNISAFKQYGKAMGRNIAYDKATQNKFDEALEVPEGVRMEDARSGMNHFLERVEMAPKLAKINQWASKHGEPVPRNQEEALQTWIKAHNYAMENPDEFEPLADPQFFIDPRKLPKKHRDYFTKVIPGLVRADKNKKRYNV